MAIKRLNPTQILKVVSRRDGAIDAAKSDLKGYVQDLDATKLVYKEGEQPTYFHIRNVPAAVYAQISDAHWTVEPITEEDAEGSTPKKGAGMAKMQNYSSMMLKYFKHGVDAIEDGGVVTKCNGEVPADMPFEVITEIGGYVFRRTSMGAEEKK